MSCCCWDSCGCASCCIGCGPTTAPQGIRGHPSLPHHPASPPATPNRFLVSSTSLPVPPVSRLTSPPQPPGCPLPVSSHTRGCPRQGDSSTQCCPNPDC